MSQENKQELDERRQLWSALMDGEADASLAARLCAAWRDDAKARDEWHEWHLIGDVLRSEDLSSAPRRDAAFIASLRARLGAEPVVIAPQVQPPRQRAARGTWAAAAAAAVVAVTVGAVVLMNAGAPDAAAPVLAEGAGAPAQALAAPPPQVAVTELPQVAVAQPPQVAVVLRPQAVVAPQAQPEGALPPQVTVEQPSPTVEPQVLVADGKLIRDARLDRYLAAHKPFGGNPALSMRAGFVRARAADADGGGR